MILFLVNTKKNRFIFKQEHTYHVLHLLLYGSDHPPFTFPRSQLCCLVLDLVQRSSDTTHVKLILMVAYWGEQPLSITRKNDLHLGDQRRSVSVCVLFFENIEFELTFFQLDLSPNPTQVSRQIVAMSDEPTSPTALADDNISSSTAAVEDDQMFELFPRLPAEVRLKIWGIACSVPRTIPLWLQLLGSDPEFHKAISAVERALISPRVNKSMYQFATSTYTPPVLESCAEAKREGSRYYTLEFGSKIQDKINEVDLTITIPPRIYVNWEVDTLCFMPPNFDSEVVEIDAMGMLESFFVDLAKGTEINRMAFGKVLHESCFIILNFHHVDVYHRLLS